MAVEADLVHSMSHLHIPSCRCGPKVELVVKNECHHQTKTRDGYAERKSRRLDVEAELSALE